MQKLDQPLKAILFDLDGTLAHTLPQLKIACCKVAKKMHVATPDDALMSTFVGNGVRMLLARVLLGRYSVKVEDVPKEKMQTAYAYFRDFYLEGLDKDFEIYPYVKESLTEFKAKQLKLAVVTNKPHIFAVPLLEHMGLSSFFDIILGGEVLDKRKPDPLPLLYVLEKLKVSPSEAIMVGDSVNDVFAAHNANMCAVAFTYGYNGGVPVESSDPEFLFNNFAQLRKLILENKVD